MNWNLSHIQQLEELLGTCDADAAIAKLKDLLLPVPTTALYALLVEPVEATQVTGNPVTGMVPAEQRSLRAVARFRDGSCHRFAAQHLLTQNMLTTTREPDMLRKHIDNGMTNTLTRAVIERAATIQ